MHICGRSGEDREEFVGISSGVLVKFVGISWEDRGRRYGGDLGEFLDR